MIGFCLIYSDGGSGVIGFCLAGPDVGGGVIGFCLEIARIPGSEKPLPGRVLALCDTSPGMLLRRPHFPQKDAFSGISDPQNWQLVTVCYPTFSHAEEPTSKKI